MVLLVGGDLACMSVCTPREETGHMAGRISMWCFDPVAVGRAECDAWVGYYRREWVRFLRSAVVLVREAFGMPWPRTLLGAWYVLRANQLWAPYPENDADGARAVM